MFMDSSKKKIKDVKIVASELKTELLANLNHFNGITLSQCFGRNFISKA